MNKIAELLRERRIARGYSVNKVIEALDNEYNIKVAAKTMYGWETGVSYPKIDIFVALCDMYGISNDEFVSVGRKNSYKKISVSDDEARLVDNYRKLDKRGQQTIDDTVARECKYAQDDSKGDVVAADLKKTMDDLVDAPACAPNLQTRSKK